MRNIIIILLISPLMAFAQEGAKAKPVDAPEKKVIKKIKYRKTQEVSFDSESVDGVARNPYGAYLTQKRGMEFAPLYRVKDHFDENIKDSVNYLKVAK
jgi:hypothetical protein